MSWNDGFYSNRYNWLCGSLAYTNGPHAISFVAGGNCRADRLRNVATPVQNNSSIYNVIYTYTKGSWIIQPYFQYTSVPTNAAIGIVKGASTTGGAILLSRAFSKGFSLAGRYEYISSSGSAATDAVNLMFGPGSSGTSVTVTPTFQVGGFFARTDLAWVHASSFTPGDVFGPAGVNETSSAPWRRWGSCSAITSLRRSNKNRVSPVPCASGTRACWNSIDWNSLQRRDRFSGGRNYHVMYCRKGLAIVFAIAVLSALAALAEAQQGRGPGQPAAPFVTHQMRPNIYWIEGGGGNSGVIVGDKGVIVIDAKTTADGGKELLESIAKITPKPVNTVILTHSDGDHVNGLAAFPVGVKVIAQENNKKEQEKALAAGGRGAPPADHLPTQVIVKDKDSLKIDGVKFEFHHWRPAHTSGDLIIFLPNDHIVFTGDIIAGGATAEPLIHLEKDGSSEGWITTVKGIVALNADQFVEGHGEV